MAKEEKPRYKSHDEPARTLEKKFGLTGISGDWKMPAGYDEAQLEYEYRADTNKAPDILQRLEEVNPGMKGLRFHRRSLEEVKSVVHGMISQLHRRDIEFYIQIHRNEQRTPNNEYYQALKGGYPRFYKYIAQFVPSDETIRDINQQLADGGGAFKMRLAAAAHRFGEAMGGIIQKCRDFLAAGKKVNAEPTKVK